jgi:hypothetical protein
MYIAQPVLRSFIPAAVLFLLALLAPDPALAIQSHRAPEGIYVHQIGHVLFGMAMLGFALRIRISRLMVRKSWQLMALGALLLFFWNGWAFVAHILAAKVPASDFVTNEEGIRLWMIIHNPVDFFYYIFKMDHILCVPAIFCIYRSLKRMNESTPLSLKRL